MKNLSWVLYKLPVDLATNSMFWWSVVDEEFVTCQSNFYAEKRNELKQRKHWRKDFLMQKLRTTIWNWKHGRPNSQKNLKFNETKIIWALASSWVKHICFDLSYVSSGFDSFRKQPVTFLSVCTETNIYFLPD